MQAQVDIADGEVDFLGETGDVEETEIVTARGVGVPLASDFPSWALQELPFMSPLSSTHSALSPFWLKKMTSPD